MYGLRSLTASIKRWGIWLLNTKMILGWSYLHSVEPCTWNYSLYFKTVFIRADKFCRPRNMTYWLERPSEAYMHQYNIPTLVQIVIICSNAAILSTKPQATYFSEMLFKIHKEIQGNALKYVVCEMAAILSQPQSYKPCGNRFLETVSPTGMLLPKFGYNWLLCWLLPWSVNNDMYCCQCSQRLDCCLFNHCFLTFKCNLGVVGASCLMSEKNCCTWFIKVVSVKKIAAKPL